MPFPRAVPPLVAYAVLAGCEGPGVIDGLSAPERLKAGDAYIDIGGLAHAGPGLFDIDGDGRRDLVVGTFTGVFAVFRDTSGYGEPRLEWQGLLQAEGTAVQIHNW